LDNTGALLALSGDLQLNGALNNNHGNTAVSGGHSLQVGQVSNDGLIQVTGPGSEMTIGGSLTDSGTVTAGSNAQISVQGPTTITNSGLFIAAGATMTFVNDVSDAGFMAANAGELDFLQGLTMTAGVHLSTGFGIIQINGSATGGTALLNPLSTLGLNGPATTNVQFNSVNSSLVLGSSTTYTGAIINFLVGDSIDAKDILFNSLQHSFDSTAGILTLSDARGLLTAMIHFQNLQVGFSFSNDGQGGTLITGVPTGGAFVVGIADHVNGPI
jgi:hypothetical protein